MVAVQRKTIEKNTFQAVQKKFLDSKRKIFKEMRTGSDATENSG